jgi:UDP-N-acetylmuramyl pentapeptide phosphotransferase/UDP-N-acetylglucosamine-1-phosphate transferase
MIKFNILLFFCTIALTFAAVFGYRLFWIRIFNLDSTPSGFGVLLSFIMLASAVAANISHELIISLLIIVPAAIAYWLDDVITLSALIRLLISFLTGVAIAIVNLHGSGTYSLIALLWISSLVGLINVALTNIVNFYDGADLNLATFIALTSTLILIFTHTDSEWNTISLACIAFIIPFAFMNRLPKTIYLGDSGSFVFASTLTLMSVSFYKDSGSVPVEAAIPVALVSFDVCFVLVIRITERHDLLTRHYLHLYQRLNRRYQGFGYLVPQIMNVLLCLAIAKAFQVAGFGDVLSAIFSMITVTIPFYFSCRWFFLPRGDMRSSTLDT